MINSSLAVLANAKVVLKKSNGQSLAFQDFAQAYQNAAAGDVLNVLVTLAVAAALAAKSNVTINILPGATVTFADKITVGAGITNFKIVGDGNADFTLNAFELTGIIGTGNEINIRGNLTVGKFALYQNADAVQTTFVLLKARNVTIAGETVADTQKAIAMDAFGGISLWCKITADEFLTVPSMTISPATGGTILDLRADIIVCNGVAQNNFATQVNITARKLELGAVTRFDDPDANQIVHNIEVDEITFGIDGGGMSWNGGVTALRFKKMVKIKNTATDPNSHVLDGTIDASQLEFIEGAILVTLGGAGSLAIKGTADCRCNRDVLANKGFDGMTSLGGGQLITDAEVLF